jgi:nitrite reductase/ring-hydroxylating ferredoxin subunit
MSAHDNDPKAHIDPRVSSPAREGLTGTASSDLFAKSGREEITIAPDFQPAEAQPAWRRDFPIDWPQDHYVERRDFVRFLVLISGALAVGQWWAALQTWWRRRALAPGARLITSAPIAIGAVVSFSYPTEHDPCVLVRLGERDYVAYSQKCTHLSCAVIPRPDRGDIWCPCHHGFFDLRTGRPTAGPPPRPLPRILLDVRPDGIYATGVDTRST